MNWQQAAPGIVLLLVKLTGTSLFFVFFPQIFPKENFTSISTENSSVWLPSHEQTSLPCVLLQEFVINKTAMANYFIGLVYSELTKKWEWIDQREHNMIIFPIKAAMDKECAAIRAGVVSPVSCYDEYNWICEKTYS
ncbi:hypothetical protein E2320_017010 [Naja naja]|nr:hypothetical protein E2320_017010 [Naja naja]